MRQETTAGLVHAVGVHPGVERWFYIGTAFVALAIVVAGFAPSIVDQASRRGPLTLLAAAHGALFTAWLILYLIQTSLAAAGRIALHRRFGATAAGLAIMMVLVGYQTTIVMARRGFDLSGDLDAARDPLQNMVFPLGNLVDFSVLVGVALRYRRRPAVHKRLMLLAVFGALMPAPLAHLLGHFGANGALIVPILAALLFSSAVHDRVRHGRVHPVSLWVGIVLFLLANVRAVVIGPSAAWHRFAAWLIG